MRRTWLWGLRIRNRARLSSCHMHFLWHSISSQKKTMIAHALQTDGRIFFTADWIIFYSELKSNIYIFIKSKNWRRVRNIRCGDNNISNTASMSWTFPSFDYLCIHGMRRPFRYGKNCEWTNSFIVGWLDWQFGLRGGTWRFNSVRSTTDWTFSDVRKTLLSGSFIYLMLFVCKSTWLRATRTPTAIIWFTENLESVWITDCNWNSSSIKFYFM